MSRRSVLFFRNFLGFTGGHLKVWHYFQHLRAHAGYDPRIYFTPESLWDDTNPWHAERAQVEAQWRPQAADCLFLAGLDWQALPENAVAAGVPIVNLLQHVRHAVAQDPRFAFLSRKAIRICVSEEVASAVRATGRANGPVLTIANGIELADFGAPRPWSARSIDVLVAGIKRPQMARSLAAALARTARIELVDQLIPRAQFLALLRNARVVLLLPNETEGFYLPALEAMAAGALAICPDCVGNRSFCTDEVNCLMPAASEEALLAAARRALQFTPPEAAALLASADATARRHGLERERRQVHAILDDLDSLW